MFDRQRCCAEWFDVCVGVRCPRHAKLGRAEQLTHTIGTTFTRAPSMRDRCPSHPPGMRVCGSRKDGGAEGGMEGGRVVLAETKANYLRGTRRTR